MLSVVTRRAVCPRLGSEVGELLAVTRGRIRQIEAQGLRRLRNVPCLCRDLLPYAL